MILHAVDHMFAFWELSSHRIINLWYCMVLITCLPSGSCHHIELSTYDTTWCWSHVCLLGVVITWNYQLLILHGVDHMSAFWELSSHRIINFLYYMVLITCLPSGSCHHMELSVYVAAWCQNLGDLSPGAKTDIDLSMAYLSRRSCKFVDLMFFFP